MADHVLPSREAMKALARMVLNGTALNEDGQQDVALVLNEVAEGRLMDREAINYEAAYRWASENFVPQKFVDQCLAAALPDRDV